MQQQQQQLLPHSNKDYGTINYWNERFTKEVSYEWLVSYTDVQDQIYQIIVQQQQQQQPSQNNNYKYTTNNDWKSNIQILIIGCGNSPFSYDMYLDGYTNITNIDYSEIVIESMKQRYSSTATTTTPSTMKWIVMDMTNMSIIQNNTYDIIIDKATMDSMLTIENDVWYPNEISIMNVYNTCSHISRILKQQTGIYLQFSLAQPHFRLQYLLGTHYEQRILLSSQNQNQNHIHSQHGLNSTTTDENSTNNTDTTGNTSIIIDHQSTNNNNTNVIEDELVSTWSHLNDIDIEDLQNDYDSITTSTKTYQIQKDDDTGKNIHANTIPTKKEQEQLQQEEEDVNCTIVAIHDPTVASTTTVSNSSSSLHSSLFGWNVSYEPVGTSAFHNFLYIMRKT